MIKIDIKPLSVNDAWRGQRFKTPEYKKYESDLLFLLPKFILPATPLKIYYEFGFSNRASDIDNPVKCLNDILQKKYYFDDKEVFEMHVKKVIVKKGKEYFAFKIESFPSPAF